MGLTLFRRHIKDCIKGYPRDFRLGRPRTKKEIKADCECPIAVDGRLRLEPKRLHNVSTDQTDWTEGQKVADRWETWQALTNPSPAPDEVPTTKKVPTIALAVKQFEGYGKFKEWEPGYAKKFGVLFRLRLIPYCEEQQIQFINRFDDKTTTDNFITSWLNMNPTKNRKLKPGQKMPEIPLSYRTKGRELERLRFFFEYGKGQGWLKHNRAKEFKFPYKSVEPKYGLESGEVERVFATIELLEDWHGLDHQNNYLETFAFCLVSRYTGLRINAVTNLDRSQLVPREKGPGWAIKIMHQQKSGWVRVPIPMSVYEALMALPIKGRINGKKYWFRTDVGSLATNIKTWRKRITTLFHKTQEPILDAKGRWAGKYKAPIEHHATPHTWRHTFAILALNDGTPIKTVSRWLGHSNLQITEDHYGHANRETHIADEIAYDESLARQEMQREQRNQLSNTL